MWMFSQIFFFNFFSQIEVKRKIDQDGQREVKMTKFLWINFMDDPNGKMFN